MKGIKNLSHIDACVVVKCSFPCSSIKIQKLIYSVNCNFNIHDALRILSFSHMIHADRLHDLFETSLCKFESKFGKKSNIFVKYICSGSGKNYKRYRKCAKGRSSKVLKRECNVSLCVGC